VSIKRCIHLLVLATVLFGGQVLGMKMRPEEIEELMAAARQAKVEATIQDPEDRDEMLRRLLGLRD
jgi:hypothetical protein